MPCGAGRVDSANHSLPIMCLGPDSSLAPAGGAGRTLSVLPPLALNFDIQVGAGQPCSHEQKPKLQEKGLS